MRVYVLPSPEELNGIERQLLERLAIAKDAYHWVRAEASEVRQGLGLNGRVALLERQALRRYVVALKSFSRFVLDRRLPRGLPWRAVR